MSLIVATIALLSNISGASVGFISPAQMDALKIANGSRQSGLATGHENAKPRASSTTFVGTLERFTQSFTPTMQGATPEEEIELFLAEHPDKSFSVTISKAVQ